MILAQWRRLSCVFFIRAEACKLTFLPMGGALFIQSIRLPVLCCKISWLSYLQFDHQAQECLPSAACLLQPSIRSCAQPHKRMLSQDQPESCIYICSEPLPQSTTCTWHSFRRLLAGSLYAPHPAQIDWWQVVAHTHHLPRHWRGRAHTLEVQQAFNQLFQYKVCTDTFAFHFRKGVFACKAHVPCTTFLLQGGMCCSSSKCACAAS